MDLSSKIVKHPPPHDSSTESGSECRMLWFKYLGSDPDPASHQHGRLFSHFSVLQLHMSSEGYKGSLVTELSSRYVLYSNLVSTAIASLNPASTDFMFSLKQGLDFHCTLQDSSLGTLMITQ